MLCPFHCKPRQSGVSIETQGVEKIAQIPGNLAEVGQNHDAYGGLGYSFSLKVKWGNISARKLETESLKSFAVSISLQNKAITT